MNQAQQQILCIEIKTMNEAYFDPTQVQPMTVYLDSASNYRLATSIKQIELAILDAIPRLGSNYRHPLLFDVQILPGDKIDALIASLKTSRNPTRNRAKRQR